jgi:mono/diheme cytochrome c family protein
MRDRKYSPAAGRATCLVAGVLALVLCAAARGSWPAGVPESYRRKVNPYAGQPDAIAAGGRLFARDCAQCHQPDALGRGTRPSLRSPLVQHATDGEIFWVLRNGILAHGMPSWSMVPEPSRWQIVAYVKSLGPSGDAAGADADTGSTPSHSRVPAQGTRP